MATGTAAESGAHGRWHDLDPLTRLMVSTGTLVAALLLDGIVCPLLLALVAVVIPAAVAGVLRPVIARGLLLSLPLGVSVVVVTLLFSEAPVDARAALAAEVVLRVLTMAGTAVLFYLTTRPSELVASLQYHGLPARATFVIHNAVATIPRLAQRAGEVAEAQRARGLDTEGSLWRRGRGAVALAVPTVLGAIRETEARTLALETRGFSSPGRPTLLWTPRDSRVQQLARSGILVALALLLLARLAGISLPC